MGAPKLILRESGRPVQCTGRFASFIPGMCCSSGDTCVMGHMWGHGKGMSTKTSDLGAIIICLTCHDLLDFRDLRMIEAIRKYPIEFAKRVSAAQIETLAILYTCGIITVPDAETI